MAEQDLGQVGFYARSVNRVARRVEASMRVLQERLRTFDESSDIYVTGLGRMPTTDELHLRGLVTDAIKFHAQAYAQLDLMHSTLTELEEVMRRLEDQS